MNSAGLNEFFLGRKMGFLKLRRAAVCLSVLLFGAALSACVPEPEAPLRIGTNVWPGYEQLYLARSLGHYDDSPIHLVELPSATEVMHALRSGLLEGAALTLDEVLSLLDEGLDLSVVLVMDYSVGADVLLARPDIKNLVQLRGKKVAVENTAVGAILLDGALEAAGLQSDEIEVIPCPLNQHSACFRTVDAVVTFDPVRTQLLSEGALQLFDSSEIPGRIVDVLVVNKGIARSHPQALSKLIAGHFLARQYLKENPQDAAQRMAPRLEIKPADVLPTFEGMHLSDIEENRKLLGSGSESLHSTAVNLARLLVEKQLLRNLVVIDGLLDNQFLPESSQ